MKAKYIIFSISLCMSFSAMAQEGVQYVTNKNGATLGYSTQSGVKIITQGGKKFKDLNKNGKLDKYEDWRLSVDERAKDLASQMSIEQIAGLMLYSGHQSVPAASEGYRKGTYDGKIFAETNVKNSALTDQQKTFLDKDNVRHVLITQVSSPKEAAEWTNNMQRLTESLPLGIPVNISSDPRHTTLVTAEYNAGAGGSISLWPDGLAMSATFDPSVVEKFGKIAAKEYRAMGITTALSPQIDLGTDPRWNRMVFTFGESPELSTDMARAYIDGFQTSTGKAEIKDGWGYESVNAMSKHWPGGGSGEGGRDAHFAYGKYAVFPRNNLNTIMKPFTEGAFKLNGKTKTTAAIMPYYTISFNQDKTYNENVGNGFSKYMVTDLLRNKYKFDGVVCTDWLIIGKEPPTPGGFAGKPWGVEDLDLPQLHYKALMAGVDQFGGNNVAAPVVEAYNIGVKEHGEKAMRDRFEQSAVRLLRNFFRIGLFENPYLNPDESAKIVGNPEFMKAGYEAQLKSIIMLKNKGNVLPISNKKTVYIPKIYNEPQRNWWGVYTPGNVSDPLNIENVKKYFNVTDDPNKADLAIVFVKSPTNNHPGYSDDDMKEGGNGYLPISLQYNTYTAEHAREHSIAAGDKVIAPQIKDRSYKGKTNNASNITDLFNIIETKEKMKGKPVIVSVTASRPMVFHEFETKVDGILLNFGTSEQALLEILSGKVEPSGLLPTQMPKDMKTVELQKEDVPFDMECHKDSEGNVYDFGFGLNWKGVIKDARTAKYKK
ncbi:MAG: glycoside hydrolase family 3 N-terminal domain-containing protein [Capnocytophaga sp.]|nr:glycoside hydrolase family 3 N-terminal domain-containing protein [Capnocytophaga sp.]